jgi:KTSC domain
MPMEMRPVRSTAISSAGYDPDIKRLEITFINGRTYTHDNVPAEVFEELVGAGSPGRYYAQNVKGVYS